MSEEKRMTLADYDFSRVKVNPPKPTQDPAHILLRVVEGAGVALWRSAPTGQAELLPTRRDLFKYEGGYSWGYNGEGCKNLAFAIIARVYEFDDLSPEGLYEKAMKLVETLIPSLQQKMEHDLSVTVIRSVLGDGQRPIF
ncbi:Uncharacterized protein ALO57_03983 [Pseudomonas coronafaciens pv. oryzae]|uniref:DUF6166 domain-containing protein n=1 Tax=Pseudomonas coronafaciens TaxID=53409 RepID=UPI0006CD1BBA|nr:DUF6166 domain-containing protein [Pseudomonas coronafaciens]KPB50656.1 Uncharacterized protein AC511_0784 [Pseudomonas coronafaciens pv. oryzae]KPY09236.1 Uncharacterized protein ALO57_03983 [Pseudomonas coronafaciens pv. oryzae]RMT03868.1 hypothetical protein ALP55_01704 [Pseudomonas coronafaciens pv. oryzae]